MPIKKKFTGRLVIHVGDLVEITVGAQRMMGEVVEDRGRIGFKGRKLYRITLQTDSADPRSIELPAEEIVVTRRASSPKKGAHQGEEDRAE